MGFVQVENGGREMLHNSRSYLLISFLSCENSCPRAYLERVVFSHSFFKAVFSNLAELLGYRIKGKQERENPKEAVNYCSLIFLHVQYLLENGVDLFA